MSQHRTWFKVILNPILRKVGWSIVSKLDDDVVIGYSLRRYPECCEIESTQ